jgi:hypothetical protein
MLMPFTPTFTAASGQTLYLDTAAGATAAVIAGRYLRPTKARLMCRAAVPVKGPGDACGGLGAQQRALTAACCGVAGGRSLWPSA